MNTWDWIMLVALLLSWAVTAASRRYQLPAPVRRLISTLGLDSLESVVREVAAIRQMSSEQRRQLACQKIEQIIERELGVKVPSSVVNLVVEYVYNRLKFGGDKNG